MARRADSDETYVIGLCDEVLGATACRQARFDFLRGDPGKGGRSVRLPVDAYYPELKLAIEYRETQHWRSIRHFDKPHRLTVSGVHRGEQRRIYDERRRSVLQAKCIRLVEIDCARLACDSRGRLRRDRDSDRLAPATLLPDILQESYGVPRVRLGSHEAGSPSPKGIS